MLKLINLQIYPNVVKKTTLKYQGLKKQKHISYEHDKTNFLAVKIANHHIKSLRPSKSYYFLLHCF